MSIWSPTISRRSIVAVVATFAVAGCAPPTMNGVGLPLTALDGPERLSLVTLCLINPNLDALVFREVQVTLNLTDAPLAIGSSNAAIVVPALSAIRMPIAVLATKQGESVRASDVSYRVDGSVGLDRAFGLNIPYRHAGHLDLVAPTASGMLSNCAGSDVAVPL